MRKARIGRLGVWAASLAPVIAIAAVCLPVGGVLAALFNVQAWETLRHLAATVMPSALLETVLLVGLVTIGVAFLGTTAAWLVAAYEFRGRAFFEWALLMPLAAPAYIVAYAYTDALQFSGPVQTALRQWMGWQAGEYWFPEIRSIPGAAFVFTVVLYPYVYLLARTAFLSRTAAMLDAARSMGLAPLAAWVRVDLPLARPAIVAGSLLALMETIADYGAVSYFGLQTFTTAIYRAWFAHGDRVAAAQLSALLLMLVLCVVWFEQRARGRARYFAPPNVMRPAVRMPLRGARHAMAVIACCIPLVLGFILPIGLLVRLLPSSMDWLHMLRFQQALTNTTLLAVSAALVVVVVVLVLAYVVRLSAPSARLPRLATRVLGLGYAIPGTVLAVGVLLPMARFDNWLDGWMWRTFGWHTGLWITGSVLVLLYAYLVRYFAVAYQPVQVGLARVTNQMEASARTLGASAGQTFFRVHLPLISPSVLAAALLVFVDVVKELPATLVLRPFDFDTLAVLAYQMAADEQLGQAAVPALAIVGVGVLPVMLLSRAIGAHSPKRRVRAQPLPA